jgi:hypothetical protein
MESNSGRIENYKNSDYILNIEWRWNESMSAIFKLIVIGTGALYEGEFFFEPEVGKDTCLIQFKTGYTFNCERRRVLFSGSTSPIELQEIVQNSTEKQVTFLTIESASLKKVKLSEVTWTDVVLENDWTNSNYSKVQFCKKSGIVFLRGWAKLVRQGGWTGEIVGSRGLKLFTLPEGFHTESWMKVAVIAQTQAGMEWKCLSISGGDVCLFMMPLGQDHILCVDGVSFPIN